MKQEDIIPNLARLEESLKSAHKRIDRIEDVSKHIQKLSVNVETMATQIKDQNVQMKEQNERMEKVINALEARIGILEKEPADRWKTLVAQIITILAAMFAGMLFSRLFGIASYYYHYL